MSAAIQFFRSGQTEPALDDWGAIAALGVGLSRAMDYFQTDPDVDAPCRGHGPFPSWENQPLGRCKIRVSRWPLPMARAKAEALSRRNYGETVKHLTTSFPHWFCGNFQKYAERVQEPP